MSKMAFVVAEVDLRALNDDIRLVDNGGTIFCSSIEDLKILKSLNFSVVCFAISTISMHSTAYQEVVLEALGIVGHLECCVLQLNGIQNIPLGFGRLRVMPQLSESDKKLLREDLSE